YADRPPLVDLVVALHDLVSGLRNIRGESKQKVLGYALLHGYASGGILIVAADRRVDLQAGESRKLLDPPTELTRGPGCEHRVCTLARSGNLRAGFAPRDQVDDVSRREWRIGGIRCRQSIEGATQIQRQVVLFHRRSHRNIKRWLSLIRIGKCDDP